MGSKDFLAGRTISNHALSFKVCEKMIWLEFCRTGVLLDSLGLSSLPSIGPNMDILELQIYFSCFTLCAPSDSHGDAHNHSFTLPLFVVAQQLAFGGDFWSSENVHCR